MNNSSPVVSPAQLRKNRIVLILLLLSFVLPFVLGHLAYFQGWYQGGKTTNKGLLLSPPALLGALQLHDSSGRTLDKVWLDRHWWLVYVLPPRCEAACRNSLFQMRQVRKATGQDSERVRLLLVQLQAPDAATDALLKTEFADMVRVSGQAAMTDQGLAAAGPQSAAAGRVYIMDPLGAIMLAYAPEADEKASILKSQDILDDLKKLLKVSQIG
jgi:cytochrome oxidase Cu insertion factor (SCO1/SenC/PrrC family)